MLVRWLRTVFSLMNSLRAISPLPSPCATSRRIAFSRAVSSGRSPRCGGSGARFARAEEIHEGLAEPLPGRLALDQDVIAALQRHEARAGNFGGEQPALLERNARVAARMHDHRRHSHARQQRAHVDFAERFENARRDLRLRRGAHQVAEPAHLLGVRVRNEQRGEQLAERRILLAPALPDQLVERLAVAAHFLAALRPTLGVAAVQHELRDALRMSHGVLDAGCAALRDAEQREAIQVRSRDDRFEVGDLRLVRQIFGVPVRQAAAARVEADQLAAGREEAEPVPPHRALPVELQVRQPVRRLDERRAAPRGRDRQAHAVGGLDEPDRLLHGGHGTAAGQRNRRRPRILELRGGTPQMARSAVATGSLAARTAGNRPPIRPIVQAQMMPMAMSAGLTLSSKIR